MSEASRPRRVLAELKWGGDPSAIVWVGSRTIHQYWPLLSGYFRDILLPPQRRADENAVSWTWREPAGCKPIGASELAGIRKRLAADHQLFAENLTRGEAGGLRGHGNVDELGTAMAGAISQLVSAGDDALASFVCRTEQGLRVHSWGAPVAAQPTYPDALEREISGRVMVRGKAAARHEVVLETAAGAAVAQTTTDAGGAFRFQNLTPGDYRLKARGRKAATWFPENGCVATLASASVSGLVLRDDEQEPDAATTRRRPWRWRWVGGAVGAALLLGGGGWIWQRTTTARATARASERASELNSSHAIAPEKPRDARVQQARKEMAPDAPRRVATAAEGGRESRGQADDASLPTFATTEKQIVVAASPLLPGENLGTPAASAAAIAGTAGVAGSNDRAGATSAAAGVASTGSPDVMWPEDASSGEKSASTKSAEVEDESSETKAAEPQQMPKHDPLRSESTVAAADAPVNHVNAPIVAAETTAATHEANATESTPSFASSDEGAEKNESLETTVKRGRMVEAEDRASPLGTQREWRVRQTPWRAHLWRDLILPTVPVPAGDAEELGALRERMLAEHVARMPATFRTGKVRGGVAFSTGDAREELAWQNADGRGRNDRDRAELEIEPRLAGETSARLVRRDGSVVAEVRFAGPEVILRVADGVEAWQWFECGEAAVAERFAWRSASDVPLPETWLSGNRVSLPLTRMQADAARSLAIVDGETGWALVGEARVKASGELER